MVRTPCQPGVLQDRDLLPMGSGEGARRLRHSCAARVTAPWSAAACCRFGHPPKKFRSGRSDGTARVQSASQLAHSKVLPSAVQSREAALQSANEALFAGCAGTRHAKDKAVASYRTPKRLGREGATRRVAPPLRRQGHERHVCASRGTAVVMDTDRSPEETSYREHNPLLVRTECQEHKRCHRQCSCYCHDRRDLFRIHR